MTKATPSIDDTPPQQRGLQCGIVMPISAIDGCSAEHWAEVKSIIFESIDSIKDFRFEKRLVSDADEIGIIQKRIVQNLYNADIVVCDVSCKNPNVMFELGMRLAFDKPTVIIKDDKTDYSFDTGIIEHLNYPRDLRFARIVDFKINLAEKIENTYQHYSKDDSQSPFLKNFGTFQVSKLQETTVTSDAAIMSMLSEMQSDMIRLRRAVERSSQTSRHTIRGMSILSNDSTQKQLIEIIKSLNNGNESPIETYIRNESVIVTKLSDLIDAPRYFPDYEEFRNGVSKVAIELFSQSRDRFP